MIKNPEIHDAYVKLEMEDEFLAALERVIRELYAKSKPDWPIDLIPDIQVINSYMTMRHNDIQTAKELLVRKDFALRDMMIIDSDSLNDIVNGIK